MLKNEKNESIISLKVKESQKQKYKLKNKKR
jgi:hypothetical protein